MSNKKCRTLDNLAAYKFEPLDPKTVVTLANRALDSACQFQSVISIGSEPNTLKQLLESWWTEDGKKLLIQCYTEGGLMSKVAEEDGSDSDVEADVDILQTSDPATIEQQAILQTIASCETNLLVEKELQELVDSSAALSATSSALASDVAAPPPHTSDDSSQGKPSKHLSKRFDPFHFVIFTHCVISRLALTHIF